MANLPTPIASAIIGEGGSGGALVMGVADRVLMLENAIYSVIYPEGAAAILYRDAGKAEAVSDVLKLTAQDLHALGIIDAVVPESEGEAHMDPAAAGETLKAHLLDALGPLTKLPMRQLLDQRYKKYRHIGEEGYFWREKVRVASATCSDFWPTLFPRWRNPIENLNLQTVLRGAEQRIRPKFPSQPA